MSPFREAAMFGALRLLVLQQGQALSIALLALLFAGALVLGIL